MDQPVPFTIAIRSKRIVCPDTAESYEVRYLADGDGQALVVTRCSRFDPPEEVNCRWACAGKLPCGRDCATVAR